MIVIQPHPKVQVSNILRLPLRGAGVQGPARSRQVSKGSRVVGSQGTGARVKAYGR